MPTSRILLWSGLAAAAGGAVLCALGWYGISGERFAERQLPYLASCTVPGAALIVAGAVLAGAAALLPGRPPEPRPAEPEETPRRPRTAPPAGPGRDPRARPDCPLVAGKPEAVPAGDAELAPCPVCEPWPP
ncbi:hypothetical protein O1L60_08200 [Streptomyces diastatochromogenes]|nr:hypothetical protein [Streptomyces diastatochromogenes]